MDAFTFMSEHPFLTFFLASIAGSTIVGAIKALKGQHTDADDQ